MAHVTKAVETGVCKETAIEIGICHPINRILSGGDGPCAGFSHKGIVEVNLQVTLNR